MDNDVATRVGWDNIESIESSSTCTQYLLLILVLQHFINYEFLGVPKSNEVMRNS